MTENYTGSVAAKTVTGSATALLDSPTTPRDGVLVTNNSPGTVVYCDDATPPSNQFPVLSGQSIMLPFRTGQVYGLAKATTTAGEALDGADVSVRPVAVTSPLARSLWAQIAGFFTQVLSQVTRRATSYDFDWPLVAGADYSSINGQELNLPYGAWDVVGRTLEVRIAGTATALAWVEPSVVNSGEAGTQTLVLAATDAPAGEYIVDVVAISVSGDDVLATVRGRIEVS